MNPRQADDDRHCADDELLDVHAPPELPGCHLNESRALYRISPLPVRTVTTAAKTTVSRRSVANRVRNLPSTVMVPICGSPQPKWSVSALIRVSTQATG